MTHPTATRRNGVRRSMRARSFDGPPTQPQRATQTTRALVLRRFAGDPRSVRRSSRRASAVVMSRARCRGASRVTRASPRRKRKFGPRGAVVRAPIHERPMGPRNARSRALRHSRSPSRTRSYSTVDGVLSRNGMGPRFQYQCNHRANAHVLRRSRSRSAKGYSLTGILGARSPSSEALN